MDIGKRLKIARDAIGYTLKEVSEKVGIGESSLSEFENSRREPKFSQLSRLAEVYMKTADFFLSDKPPSQEVVLWRDKPSTEEERKQIEARFKQLCEQYRKLEFCTYEIKTANLPKSDFKASSQFNFDQAELLAVKVQSEFCLGEIPALSLKQTLEEKYYVKIFYLDFSGSAISTVSPEYGPAILLNKNNKSWRRNYDLAHELFHILVWNVFRTAEQSSLVPDEREEQLANSFASKLLMPEQPLKARLISNVGSDSNISLANLDDIAREFCVSLDALIYRIADIFRLRKEETVKFHEIAEKCKDRGKPRESDVPDTFPQRYRDLAQRALREGKLSLIQFAKYMDISYKKAQEYLSEQEDFTDEKISIPVA